MSCRAGAAMRNTGGGNSLSVLVGGSVLMCILFGANHRNLEGKHHSSEEDCVMCVRKRNDGMSVMSSLEDNYLRW